jgi:outer membrane protein OmpA-like peptidoglycan-associated protein
MAEQDLDEARRYGLFIAFVVVAVIVASVLALGVSRSRMHARAPQAAAPSTSVLIEETDVPALGAPLTIIYFETGQSAMPASAAQPIEQIIDAMNATPAAVLVLSGYHDASGDPARNAQLAKERAMHVREALTARGVPAERVLLRKPEVAEAGGADSREARRVEIRLYQR